jgi:hypothetical protein
MTRGGAVEAIAPKAVRSQKPPPSDKKSLVYVLDLGGRTPEAFHRSVRAAEGTDRLPPPPEVDLGLEVRNAGGQEVRLWLGAEGNALRLDLRGPGAVSVAAPPGPEREPFAPRVVTLAPGQTYTVPVRRLAFGPRGAARYAYWTEPGDYSLRMSCTLAVAPAPRGSARAKGPEEGGPDFGYITVRSAPVLLQVVPRR